ncbi:MAG: ferritin-like domain-containing protein [Clostridia bacterium]|nr:ferritin-like domain-containing protein [Clostridia bacterium]
MDEWKLKKFCYSKIIDIKTNPFYSEILQNLYMEDAGEVYSYLQFCYQSFLLLPFENEVGNLFEKIASDDFLHMKLLSHHIVILGGNPIFSNSKGIWLRGRNINYSKNIKSMLIANIEIKENSLINYKIALTKIEDRNLKKLLNSIILDEDSHLKKLKDCLKKLS